GAIDVLAAGHDHVLGPVDQEHEALLVLVAEVAGAVPAVDEGGRRLFGLVPVARHHVGAADDDLADLTFAYFGAVGIGDADVDSHHRLPARAAAGTVEQVLLPRHRSRDRSGLGGAVIVDELRGRKRLVSTPQHLGLTAGNA